nr:hypothetical protein [Tanacetum cinerariifolium]
MLLKKLPEKLGDLGKFLIPSNFPGMDVCHALADLGASINLMPLSIWKKLSLPELTPTQMTLELADRSITRPKGVAEDVFVKVGKFHFPTDFVVVDFEVDPRGGNLTSTSEPILFDSSHSLTPFKGSDFILEEIEAFLKDESISSKIDHADCDPEEDICLIKKLLNNDPFQLPLMDLKQREVVKEISSIEEPPKLELKDLPSHLEYAYLEGVDNLPVIIAKDLKVEEKEALLKVLKSHKRAIAWKITDIKGGITVVENENNELIPTRMPFGLCNAPRTIQRCMMAIFDDMIEKTMEVFMDDFLVFGDSFSSCLSYLDTMLQRCEDTNLVLNWEKCHFMVKERIILGHKISKNRLKDCIDAFETLKKKLTEAAILVVPDWNLPFELMYAASDFTIGAGILSSKGCHPSNRRNSLRTLNITSGTIPTFFEYVQIKSFEGVYMAKKILISSNLVMKDPPGAIMVSISPPRKTTYKTPIWCTPYKLVNGKSYHLPIELEHKAYWALKHVNFDIKTVDDHRKLQLNELQIDHADCDPEGDICLIEKLLNNDMFQLPLIDLKQGEVVKVKSSIEESLKLELKDLPSHLELAYLEGEDKLLVIIAHKAYWALKHVNFDIKTVDDHRKLQLNELRDQAYENSLIYKEKTKKLHDSKIKSRIFSIGDRVLLFNSRLKMFSGKLKTRWSGPFTITKVFSYGTVELSQLDGRNFKVNGHRVKHYFGGTYHNDSPGSPDFPRGQTNVRIESS